MDCNRCACINGRLSCTRRECEQDEVGVDVYDSVPERNCRICGLLKYLPVCGIDGITYPTVCFAVTCRGLSIDELTEGSCTGRVSQAVKRKVPTSPPFTSSPFFPSFPLSLLLFTILPFLLPPPPPPPQHPPLPPPGREGGKGREEKRGRWCIGPMFMRFCVGGVVAVVHAIIGCVQREPM